MKFIDLDAQYRKIETGVNARIKKVLEHGQYIMGPEVRELEEQLEAFVGAKHCIGLASGTDALMVALMALGVGYGDEVITTSFTFFASAEVIMLLGATPVCVDINPDTFNIDVEQIEAAITNKTKAIMPVSLYGQPADMQAINAIAAKHSLPVIEDGAQSLGATHHGKQSCSLSTIGCTSFFPSKPLGCYGDGGAAFTNDDELAKKMREIRVHGQSKRYTHTSIGVNARIDTLQAAILLEKLTVFPEEIKLRQTAAAQYSRLLAKHFITPIVAPENTSAYAQYTIRVPERERMQAELKERGIPTAVHYPIPVTKQPALADLACAKQTFPHAEKAAREVMSLPMHPYLTLETIEEIVEAIAEPVAA